MPSASEWRITKTEAVGRRGMVAADNAHAARAGIRALEDGGNAVDAAIAAAFAMGVVEPFTSGVGGVAAMVIRTADGNVTVIDGSATAPLAARADMYELLDSGERLGMYGWPATRDNANNVGWRSVGVPGMVAACLLALERYGTLPRERVLEDAIALAEHGVDVDWYLGLAIGTYAYRLWPFAETKRVYYRAADGAPLRVATGFEPADRLVQPDLARTLRAIAAGGADAFYRGKIGLAIARDSEANGGLITREELAAYEAREHAPLRATYRDVELFTLRGPGGGVTAVELLNLLEQSASECEQGSARELHAIAEASRRAFADRFAHLADVPGAPFDVLASKEWARRRRIDPDRAAPDEGAGAIGHDPDRTTNLCAADDRGTLVALTSTLGQGFGSAVVAKDTGVLLADVMTWFDPRPRSINSPAPGKRILWAPAPTIVLRDGRPVAAVGAPGGRRIMSAVPQVIHHLVAHRDGPQDAANRPRVHCEGRATTVDSRVAPDVRAALAAMGHEVEVKEETFFSSHFARPSAITVAADGTLRGGVNAMKPALAIGL